MLPVGAGGARFVGLLLDDALLPEDPAPTTGLGKLVFVFVGGGSRLGRFGM